MNSQTVAFIGVGRMGEPMAGHVLRHGFPVTAYDVNPAPLQRMGERGATIGASVAEAARSSDIVITMLPSDEALQDISPTLLDSLQPSQVFIDMSTNRLPTSHRLAQRLADRGVAMLDAPVTGGEGGAQAGTLNIMVGGDADVFTRCLPVLQAMAKVVTHIGPQGHGLIAKYVNQMIMEATFAVVAEAYSFAETLGADRGRIYEAIRSGGAASWVMDLAVPQMLSGAWGQGRELALHTKDGAYVLAAAETAHAWTPMTALSHELFKLAVRQGEGDHSAAALALVYNRG
jgi:3-hydroxyisobutyrate dehydrogenase-like beta-hydroxyacid dehydrogenase